MKIINRIYKQKLLSTLLTVARQFAAIISVALISFDAMASLRCEQVLSISKAPPQSETLAGIRLLLEKDQRLHVTPMVEKAAQREGSLTGVNLTRPADKVMAWVKHLESISSKAQVNQRVRKAVYETFYAQFVIKPEHVPESYFELQIRLAQERGHGPVEISPAQKDQLIENLIVDQKRSLDLWVDYMLSPDSAMYPMWAKYWMINGMAKLSKFNPENGTFGNRSKETVAPFPELNREALAYVVDALIKRVEGRDLSSIQDPKLIELLPGAQFGKMYAHALSKAGVGQNRKFITNEGRWIVYKQGTDHLPLVKSLEGHNTGWCTAGESTAKSQLSLGDFYVYYSLDTQGRPSVPRVAIRMQGKEIAEVRGVAESQNLDKQISESSIVTTKLKDFGPEADKYVEKDLHMKKLTEIARKSRLGQEVSKDEILFLYEVNGPIKGFGHGKDPRIEEIKLLRDRKSDIAVLFDGKYRKEEISLTAEEALSGKSKLHYGDLDLSGLTSANGLKLPETIFGNLYLWGLTSAEGVRLPETVQGSLILTGLISAPGLILPKNIGGRIDLSGLTSAQGIKFPEVTSELDLGGLTSPIGLQLPKIIKGNLTLMSLPSAQGLKFPETIQGSLYLGGLTSAQGLTLPKTVYGTLNLNGLTSPEGLILPEAVYGDLILNKLQSGKGLRSPIGANVRTKVKFE